MKKWICASLVLLATIATNTITASPGHDARAGTELFVTASNDVQSVYQVQVVAYDVAYAEALATIIIKFPWNDAGKVDLPRIGERRPGKGFIYSSNPPPNKLKGIIRARTFNC